MAGETSSCSSNSVGPKFPGMPICQFHQLPFQAPLILRQVVAVVPAGALQLNLMAPKSRPAAIFGPAGPAYSGCPGVRCACARTLSRLKCALAAMSAGQAAEST